MRERYVKKLKEDIINIDVIFLPIISVNLIARLYKISNYLLTTDFFYLLPQKNKSQSAYIINKYYMSQSTHIAPWKEHHAVVKISIYFEHDYFQFFLHDMRIFLNENHQIECDISLFIFILAFCIIIRIAILCTYVNSII